MYVDQRDFPIYDLMKIIVFLDPFIASLCSLEDFLIINKEILK